MLLSQENHIPWLLSWKFLLHKLIHVCHKEKKNFAKWKHRIHLITHWRMKFTFNFLPISFLLPFNFLPILNQFFFKTFTYYSIFGKSATYIFANFPDFSRFLATFQFPWLFQQATLWNSLNFHIPIMTNNETVFCIVTQSTYKKY